jgi:glutamate--cysteine ligase
LSPAVEERFKDLARKSWDAQRKIEAADTMPFELYLQEYLSPRHLVPAAAR